MIDSRWNKSYVKEIRNRIKLDLRIENAIFDIKKEKKKEIFLRREREREREIEKGRERERLVFNGMNKFLYSENALVCLFVCFNGNPRRGGEQWICR